MTAAGYSTELKEGDLAPDFTLPAGDGRQISLRDFRGKNVVLYFYPKDDTPGCTKEACSFRDTSAELAALEAVVLGISPDPVSSHQRFATKYNIPFPLLADVEHRVASAYGVWVEKHAYGQTYMGNERSTFLIGPDGHIRKIWRHVKPEGHAKEVAAWLAANAPEAASRM